jgi:hypothetical protein
MMISHEKKWPKTVKEAVGQILSSMSDKEKTDLRNTKSEDLDLFHHGWGTDIRNGLGLWEGNEELMRDTKEFYPDDASIVIIEAVWKELHKVRTK